MYKTPITRRKILTHTPAILAGLFLLGPSALAKENDDKAKGPPGSCGRWADVDRDGSCDQSGTCRRTRCPAHAKNSERKSDAPDGTCALWNDKDGDGLCEVSFREQRPCPCLTCPANCHNDS